MHLLEGLLSLEHLGQQERHVLHRRAPSFLKKSTFRGKDNSGPQGGLPEQRCLSWLLSKKLSVILTGGTPAFWGTNLSTWSALISHQMCRPYPVPQTSSASDTPPMSLEHPMALCHPSLPCSNKLCS